MLVIRLFRTGKKNQPSFKVVVTDKTRPTRAGRFLEILGFYNSLTKKRDFKADRIKYWISVGAQPSDTVHNLLVSEKIISGKKIPSHNKVEKPVEQKPAEPAPAAQAPEPKVEAPAQAPAETPKEEVATEQPKEETPVVEEKPSDSSVGEKAEEGKTKTE